VDLSRAALAVARRNVQALAPGKVRLAQSDLFAKIPNRPCWDLILSNPPYLTDGDYAGLLPGLRYEPALALRAGPEGLEFYRRLGPEARTRLAPGGALLVETGAGQGAAVAALLARAGFVNPQVHRDLAGLDRLVTGERGNY
jgi:release factor glutamine methyltransferase